MLLIDLHTYFMTIFDFFMVFAPNFGFIAQIMKFKEVKSSEGFSKFLSFILLIANILRIFFWVGKRFPLPLLLQSIVSILMQLCLINECLKYANGNCGNKYDTKYYMNYKPVELSDYESFWNWPYLIDYTYFLLLFTLVVGFFSHSIGFENKIYVEVLGSVSASVEAIIGIPQIIKNFTTKNTKSLSSYMIYTWVLGDFIKSYYFISTNSPLQLIVCGVFQFLMDNVILMQILYYNKDLNTGEEIKNSSSINKDKNSSRDSIDFESETDDEYPHLV